MIEARTVTASEAGSEPAASEGGTKRSKTKSYGKTAKVGAMWTLGRETVTQLMGIPTAMILARLLSPADFGIAAAAAFFIQLGKKLGNMGLNSALVRMKDVREEHRASVFVMNAATGLTAWVVLMLAAPSLGDFYNDDRVTNAVRVGGTIFLVNFFGAVEYAVLQREMRFKQMAFVEWTAPLLFMPTAIGLAWAGYGYWSLIIGQVVSNIGVTCSKIYFGRWRPSLAVTRRGLAETVPFGMGIYAKRLLSYSAENLDSLIVGALFGVSSLGYYDKAFNGAETVTGRMALGANVMFRIFAIIQEERERFVRAYTKVVLTGTIVTFPVLTGMIVAGPTFIVVVFGQKWLPAVVPFQLLCASGALRVLTGYASAAVQASGRIWSEVWRKIAHVVLLGVLILAFRGWGIEGAAFGVFLAYLTLAVLMQGLVMRITRLSWREMTAPLWPGLLASILVCSMIGGVTYALDRVAPHLPDWLLLGAQISAGALGWVGFTLFVRFSALQDVVDEVLDDVVPPVLRKQIDRVRKRRVQVPQS